MPLVAIGVLLLVLKLAEIGPVGEWSWWIILAPFGAAVLWWEFADTSGLTQRKAIEKMEKRKSDRRDRALESLGLNHQSKKQVERARSDAASRRSSADPTKADVSASQDQPPRRDPSR